MSGKVIQNDEQYETARQALLKIAGELGDPLNEMSPDERKKKMGVYDRTADLMKYYTRGRDVQQDPSKATLYALYGWDYQRFD